MAGVDPYIGCWISVLAKSGQRYEGVLREIRMESSSIILSQGMPVRLYSRILWLLGSGWGIIEHFLQPGT